MRNHFLRERWDRDEPRLFAIVTPPARSQARHQVQHLVDRARHALAETTEGFLACVPDQWLHVPLLDMGWSNDITEDRYRELLRTAGQRLDGYPVDRAITIRAGAPQVRQDGVALVLEDDSTLAVVAGIVANGATEALGGGRPAEFDFYRPGYGPAEQWRERRDRLPEPHRVFVAIPQQRRPHLPVAYGIADDDSGAEFGVLDTSPRRQGLLDPWDEAVIPVDWVVLVDMRQDREQGCYTWTERDAFAVSPRA